MKKVIFPGSFNPIHNDHIKIIEHSLVEYDHIFVYVANNENKKYSVSLKKRKEVIEKALSSLLEKWPGRISIVSQTPGILTPYFAKENDIKFVVRGVRGKKLSEYEEDLAEKYHDKNEELIFNYIINEEGELSSTKIRDLIKQNKEIKGLVPEKARKEIEILWQRGN